MKNLTMPSIRLIVALSLLSVVALPTFVLAQTGAGTETRPAALEARVGAKEDAAKERAGREIDRRVKALSALSERVVEMKRVGDDFKQALQGNVQNQVGLLTALKTKIETATSTTIFREDIQSITSSYRIYALVAQQGRISAMADKEAHIIIMMQALGAKLQARLQAVAAGVDAEAATAAFTDFGANLTEAQTRAQAAVNAILPLQPDNGDKTIADTNAAALKQARSDLKAARTAIEAARKNLETLRTILKSAKPPEPAATSTSATSSQ